MYKDKCLLSTLCGNYVIVTRIPVIVISKVDMCVKEGIVCV